MCVKHTYIHTHTHIHIIYYYYLSLVLLGYLLSPLLLLLTRAKPANLIRIKIQGGREVLGELRGFDHLVNVVLDECEEFLRGMWMMKWHGWNVCYCCNSDERCSNWSSLQTPTIHTRPQKRQESWVLLCAEGTKWAWYALRMAWKRLKILLWRLELNIEYMSSSRKSRGLGGGKEILSEEIYLHIYWLWLCSIVG